VTEKLDINEQLTLVQQYSQINHWQSVIKILQQLISAFPKNTIFKNQLAYAAAKHRNYPLAIRAFEEYLAIITPTADEYVRFADLLLIAKNIELCQKTIQKALALGAIGSEIHVIKAKCFLLQANYPAALTALRSALTITPHHSEAWSNLVKLPDGDYQKLDQDIKKILSDEITLASLSPHNVAILHFSHFTILEKLEKFSEAANALRHANNIQASQVFSGKSQYSMTDTENNFHNISLTFNADFLKREKTLNDKTTLNSTPIFILGMPRSGTTLTEQLLSQHKDVQACGELEAMEFVAAEYQYKLSQGIYSSIEEMTIEQWSELRHSYIKQLPEIHSQYFTDKMPHNFRHVGLILKLFPEAKIIQMHRPQEDVCFSIYSHAFPAGHTYANNFHNLMHYYQCTQKLMRHWSSFNSNSIYDLNYMDLVNEPKPTAEQVFNFCELDWDDSYLDFHRNVTASFTFSELQVRKPITKSRTGRWKNYSPYIPELTN